MLNRLIPYVLGLFAIMILLAPHSLHAQYTSNNGNFEVDQVRGCPGLTVNITNNSGIDCGTVGCDFDYKGDGYNSPPAEDIKPDPFTFTYDEPGQYELYILFGTIEDFITITIEDKPEPEFEIFTCAGNGVTVLVTDTEYEEYAVDFGDGSPLVVIPAGSPEITHTYASSVSRTISVQGRDTGWANNCNAATQAFTPVAALPAAVINGLTITGDEEITLALGTTPRVRYRLFISTNGGPYNILRTFSDGRTTEVIDLPFLANNYYCFRLDAIDPCGGPAVSSDEVCSIRLRGQAQNNQNTLTWQTNDPGGDFEIYRDGILIGSVNASERSFADNDIICGTTYCYSVRTVFGSATSVSSDVCITSDNTLPPEPVLEVATVPEGSAVTLSWIYDDLSGSTNFDIFRSENGLNPVQIGSTSELTFTDNEAFNPGFTTFCYEIVPRDACGNSNNTNAVACVLQPSGSISLQDQVQISWPPYSGYTAGVDYYFIQKSYDGINFINQAQTADTVFAETDTQSSQIVFYRIRVIPVNDSADVSFSYAIRLIKSNQLFYPDAFTPDGDGLNDTFDVRARFVTDYTMDIFNRWGELIFHTENIDTGWNGLYRGETVPQGTYIMKLRLIDEAGQQTTRESSILVLPR